MKSVGPLDIQDAGRNPHRFHRISHRIDFDAGALFESTADRQAMVDHSAGYGCICVETPCEAHADTHFHAYVGPTRFHRSLQTEPEPAENSRNRGQTAAARERLESFLAELDARHGQPPGKHMNKAAYWLLPMNVEHLLGRL